MHIKEVNITGFRSYREGVHIDSFSPRHNVVVGRNGSGKSNFFYAIQFVLSDEYSTLRAEQRMGVLHEGAGQRSTSARVEIVFDNSDRRIPAVDASEVRVVRQIGQKKDQYFIDNKVVPRAEIVNLMESAGFSRSNPYYIVKQGKINELATSPDPHRLQLLREVAGTRVYDERKEESLKILKETKQKTQKIEDLLKFIDERLKTLEEEKEDLKEYQKWDRAKRSIEYTICETEINETRKKMDRLADQRDEFNQKQNRVNAQLLEVQTAGSTAATNLRKLENKFKGMKDEKDSLKTEKDDRMEKQTKLQLMVKDMREDVDKERTGRDNAEDDLNKLKGEIAEKLEELEKITPEYRKHVEKEAALNLEIRLAENRSNELFSKQGHRAQFKTTAERDDYLRGQIRSLIRKIEEVEEQISNIATSQEEEEKDEEELNAQVRELGIELQENHVMLEKANSEHARLKQDLDRAVVEQLEARRELQLVNDNINGYKGEVSQMEHVLRTVVARPTMQGVESVRQVIKWFKENNKQGQYQDIIDGYKGLVIDLIECGPEYFQAVEVTAGNRLFYHVVSDDRIATKILTQINKQGLPGESSFFPLNRIPNSNRRATQIDGAHPMLDILDYDPQIEQVCRSIFGGVAIVRDMKTGSIVSKNEGFDCVTLEGDQVSRRGALTGGYMDIKRNKMEVHTSILNCQEQLAAEQRKLEEINHKLKDKLSVVERIRGEIDRVENDMRSYKSRHHMLTEKKRNIGEQLHNVGRSREQQNSQILHLRNRSKEMKAQQVGWEAEIGSDLLSQLSINEKSECERLQKELRDKRHQLEEIVKKRVLLEDKKQKLENQLHTNLYRKRDNLQTKISDISVDEKRHYLQAEQAELQSVMSRIHEITKRMNELDEHLLEYEEAKDKLSREIEDAQEQTKDLEAQTAEYAKQADIICTQQSSLQTKREESLKKIRELGSLPGEALGKYQGMTNKQLDKKLAECLSELKKYENVNKRALDQFVAAASQKEDLSKRMSEQQSSQKAIEDLLEVMETRKYEAITLTFKQVSKNFAEVFQKLVPTGTGKLIMQTKRHEEDAPQENLPTIEQFTGVGIKVSFNGTSETKEMQQLSGGQKSLVALALIFAIQMCDPAPFYLFDEIDAALDAQHRKAVADMIHELSANAQFITTTFRSELLEHAEKYYGVRFRNKVSHIDAVSKEQAYDFVEDDQTHG